MRPCVWRHQEPQGAWSAGFGEVDQGRPWVVEEPYGVASEGIGGLLAFSKPPRTIKGMVPNGGADRQRSG